MARKSAKQRAQALKNLKKARAARGGGKRAGAARAKNATARNRFGGMD
jgi:hypothetical protein